MSRWFRFYGEALHDPKVQSLDPDLFKIWVNCLCVASQHEGKLPEISDLAFALRMTEGDTISAVTALVRHGLCDSVGNQHAAKYKMHGWDKRQYKSDSSAARVREHRKRKCNVTETPPETDTETEEITNVISIDVRIQDSFGEFWDLFPRKRRRGKGKCQRLFRSIIQGKKATAEQLISAVRERRGFDADPDFAVSPEVWLNQGRWEDDPPEGVTAAMSPADVAAADDKFEKMWGYRPER